MRIAAIFVLLLSAGCTSQSEKEKEKYYMIERNALPGISPDEELCEQGRITAAAYLDERNEDQYRVWKSRSESHCIIVALKRGRY